MAQHDPICETCVYQLFGDLRTLLPLGRLWPLWQTCGEPVQSYPDALFHQTRQILGVCGVVAVADIDAVQVHALLLEDAYLLLSNSLRGPSVGVYGNAGSQLCPGRRPQDDLSFRSHAALVVGNFDYSSLDASPFYALLDQHLSASGYAVIQTTSPLIARKSFWTVVSTLEAVDLQTTPYHAHVPSFGEWGFVLAHHRPWRMPTNLPRGLQFVTASSLPALFDFPPDMARVDAEPNRLSNQVLVQTFEAEWGRIHQ